VEKKLYVGNLPYDVTEDDLRTMFAQAGTVTDIYLVKDRDTGSSKGFAFVEMGTQSEAEEAIKQFNGAMLGNRELKVNIARPKEERGPSRFGDRGGGGGRDSSRDRNRGSRGGPRRY
jgi:RNA recognition motif-containing protein